MGGTRGGSERGEQARRKRRNTDESSVHMTWRDNADTRYIHTYINGGEERERQGGFVFVNTVGTELGGNLETQLEQYSLLAAGRRKAKCTVRKIHTHNIV